MQSVDVREHLLGGCSRVLAAGQFHHQLHVLAHAQHIEQPESLEDEADVPEPEVGERGVGELMQRTVAEVDRPRVGRIRPPSIDSSVVLPLRSDR